MQADAQTEERGSAGEAAERAAENLIRAFDEIDFVYIALVVGVAVGLIWVLRRFVPWIAKYVPTRYRLPTLGILPIARLVILVVAIALIVPEVINLSRENILVIGGALGVALGFGFKDLIASIVAGVVAVFEKTYRPGDWVRVGEHYGEVVRVGLRAFQLRTASDDVVTITHDRIWSEHIANSNDGATTLMDVVEFFVAPDHDAERVRAALREVAMTSAYLDYSRPVAVQLSESPLGTHYKLKAYPFDLRDQFEFISDLTVRGKRALRDAGAKQVTAAVAGTGTGTGG